MSGTCFTVLQVVPPLIYMEFDAWKRSDIAILSPVHSDNFFFHVRRFLAPVYTWPLIIAARSHA